MGHLKVAFGPIWVELGCLLSLTVKEELAKRVESRQKAISNALNLSTDLFKDLCYSYNIDFLNHI